MERLRGRAVALAEAYCRLLSLTNKNGQQLRLPRTSVCRPTGRRRPRKAEERISDIKNVTTLICIVFIAVTFASTAGAKGKVRPVEQRITWLKERVKEHHTICQRRIKKNYGWDCRALRWSKKELSQARAEKRRSWYTLSAPDDWLRAVRIAQRVYPGTESWLLSCSHAEGGHGRWVRYGGGAYYPGYENTDQVGGWMQYRPSTYYAYVGKAIGYARQRGFTLPSSAGSWLSPLGQALTGGYMRAIARNTSWHWSASVGNGC